MKAIVKERRVALNVENEKGTNTNCTCVDCKCGTNGTCRTYSELN